MKVSHFLTFKSDKAEIDTDWNEAVLEINSVPLNIGDILSLNGNEDWEEDLLKDYGTKKFKISDRLILIDTMYGYEFECECSIDIIVEPIYN